MKLKVDNQTIICFDLDDTLYNEVDYLKSAYYEIAMDLDQKNGLFLYAKMFSLYRNKSNVFDYLIANYGITLERLLSYYRTHIPIIKPFSGTEALFESIKKKHGKVVLITDGRSSTQRTKLKALGLLSYFDMINISEELGTEKPSEFNYRVVEEQFPNSRYVYIADNFRKDFIVPNQRNWDSIGLIDNGLNVHNTCFNHQSKKNKPKELVLKLNQIQIV